MALLCRCTWRESRFGHKARVMSGARRDPRRFGTFRAQRILSNHKCRNGN